MMGKKMMIAISRVSVGDKNYKVSNGTYYNPNTSSQMIYELEKIRTSGIRVLLDYGDTETGQSWGEVHDVAGTIGRSMGPVKIPILLYNSRSNSGGGILTDCVVQILTSRDRRVIYKHPTYKLPKKDYVLSVDVSEEPDKTVYAEVTGSEKKGVILKRIL